jgi:chloramphenicol-sensitive protein RarD
MSRNIIPSPATIPPSVGILYAILAYTTWGFLPLYWKLLEVVPAGQILAHRIIWSFLFIAGLLFISHRWHHVSNILSSRTNRFAIIACAFFISANWYIYIWAVNANHVIEASLGYYINPLISILMGMLFLQEKLNRWQLIAVLFAFLGVLILTIQFGRLPWIAIILAVSFACYGLIKKLANLDSVTGLLLETLLVVPVALIYLTMKYKTGAGVIGHVSWDVTLLLIGTGVITALPLIWFANGAKAIPLSTIGFIQYLSPSITLLLGVFVFKEAFTITHLLSFTFIWLALLLYSLSKTHWMKQVVVSKEIKKNYNS